MPDTATDEVVVGSHVLHVMGTVVSFDLRDGVPADAYQQTVEFLRATDERFSTYREDSEISRLRRGDLRSSACHPDVDEVLGLCLDATTATDGYFTAFPYGDLDPTGLVKGWAIHRASQMLAAAGAARHAVNGGGDIQLASAAGQAPWRIGIADPANRQQVIAVATSHHGGVATSGVAERGHHIVNPRTALTARYFTSVTIVAPTVLDADVLATAAFAMGEGAMAWIESQPKAEGLFVSAAHDIAATSGFPFG